MESAQDWGAGTHHPTKDQVQGPRPGNVLGYDLYQHTYVSLLKHFILPTSVVIQGHSFHCPSRPHPCRVTPRLTYQLLKVKGHIHAVGWLPMGLGLRGPSWQGSHPCHWSAHLTD